MKFGLGLFLAGSASLMLVGCDKAPSRNSASASQDHLARIKEPLHKRWVICYN